MGRAEPSVGRPPASFRRDARAKRAKATINQLIPSLLSTHPRARRGIDAAELIVDPPSAPQAQLSSDAGASTKQATSAPAAAQGPRLSLHVADTLTSARTLLDDDAASGVAADLGSAGARVAILNMASPLSPGGGFLNGATSQEESLCMRTTLLPSLKDNYYLLPDLGAVFTPNVLVFRDELAEEVLPKNSRWFVNCVSAAMLRGPEVDLNEIGQVVYSNQKDREMAIRKMRVVMRICQAKGIKKVVLGAWGCGAYGNPVGEIARAWRKVLLPERSERKGPKSGKETWQSIDEVVFAIKDVGMAEAFRSAFGEDLLPDKDLGVDADNEEDENMDVAPTWKEELQEKIQELEHRIEATSNPVVRQGLNSVLGGLQKQLQSDDA